MKLLIIISLALVAVACNPQKTFADSYHHHTINTSAVKSAGTALGLACGGMNFIPSNDLQAGVSMGGYNGANALCFGGAFTTGDGALVGGRIGSEEGEIGYSVSGTWRFK